MENYAKLERFFNAADELITGKFILADTKIGELLRSVATCEELTGLFAAATEGYNYPAAKQTFLREAEGSFGRGEAFLPDDRSEILAFVFCLLVDFDSGRMKFGDFLLHYFYEDGSYTASYERFANTMLRPFRDIVRDCFPAPDRGAVSRAKLQRQESAVAKLTECIVLERSRIAGRELSQEDAAAAGRILGEMQVAVGRGDIAAAKALLLGYVYFLQVTGSGDESSDALFRAAEEVE